MKQKCIVTFATTIEVEVDVEPRKSWRDGDRWAKEIKEKALKGIEKMDKTVFEETIFENLTTSEISLPDPVTDPQYQEKTILIE